ncbi:hypothetical protein T265_08422 [Opisthorchis viverrini]|uniref:Uncharacterized protein n=1 Tax=Opisthorchis viverrini TaxID=6198 RepID=A0A074ZK84_OPIVI|nr:hypothetical protein T265_08422 [Opisthorchis viverrini]KER23770.1 hypothetical protein T265_08422 [Opisthorchis viverrini]
MRTLYLGERFRPVLAILMHLGTFKPKIDLKNASASRWRLTSQNYKPIMTDENALPWGTIPPSSRNTHAPWDFQTQKLITTGERQIYSWAVCEIDLRQKMSGLTDSLQIHTFIQDWPDGQYEMFLDNGEGCFQNTITASLGQCLFHTKAKQQSNPYANESIYRSMNAFVISVCVTEYTHLQLDIVFTADSTKCLVYDILQLNGVHKSFIMFQLTRRLMSEHALIFISIRFSPETQLNISLMMFFN